ncbi:MAG TPA: glycosyltransferase [Elainellaceae cyanobacterium]
MSAIAISLSLISLFIWIYLLCYRGQFWQTRQHLEAISLPFSDSQAVTCPSITVVIPARNEADVLPTTVRSLVAQRYPGNLDIIVVDDHSTDGTANVAQQAAEEIDTQLGFPRTLRILHADPLPAGWTGKLWALEQGTQYALNQTPDPQFILLTDADIEHDPDNLYRLVTQAQHDSLDLVSIMVRLRCQSVWEKLLIPAFVFFFQKLYPFSWVNNPQKQTAAAAGGCALIRPAALKRIGGIAAIRHALIDDCALANAVKWTVQEREVRPSAQSLPRLLHPPIRSIHPIWLGLSSLTCSLRPYPDLKTIWDMVARTAYTQLHYSPLLLLGTLLGMTWVYLVPPLSAIAGMVTGQWGLFAVGLSTWLLMAIAYVPILRFYRVPLAYAACLPAIAFLYTLMTLDSARRHWQGRGGAWKGRVYQ